MLMILFRCTCPLWMYGYIQFNEYLVQSERICLKYPCRTCSLQTFQDKEWIHIAQDGTENFAACKSFRDIFVHIYLQLSSCYGIFTFSQLILTLSFFEHQLYFKGLIHTHNPFPLSLAPNKIFGGEKKKRRTKHMPFVLWWCFCFFFSKRIICCLNFLSSRSEMLTIFLVLRRCFIFLIGLADLHSLQEIREGERFNLVCKVFFFKVIFK